MDAKIALIARRIATRVAAGKDELSSLLSKPKLSAAQRQQIRDEYADNPWAYPTANGLRETHDALRSVPAEELIGLWRYLGNDGYRQMNDALRTGTDWREWDEEIVGAAAALGRLPAGSRTVYRGAVLPAEVLGRYVKGAVVSEAGFTSAAEKRSVANIFAKTQGDIEKIPTVFIIENNGAGRSVGLVAQSQYYAEGEVVFPPGTRFEVLGRRTTRKTGQVTIRLRQV